MVRRESWPDLEIHSQRPNQESRRPRELPAPSRQTGQRSEKGKTMEVNETGAAIVLWTVDDMSAVLRISRSGIYNLVAQGRIPAPVRIGKAMRWDRDDVLGWLQEQKGRA